MGKRLRGADPHAASPPAPLTPALDFAVPDQDGAPRRLAEFRGHPLVLFFFPRAGTPG